MEHVASTLGELIAPLTEPEFLSLLRRRKLSFVRGREPSSYSNLLGWAALQRMLETGNHPKKLDHFRVTRESVIASTERWASKGKVDIEKLEGFLADGFSLVMTHIEPHVPPLADVCAAIRSQFLETSYAGVIVTSGKSGAFKLHYDFEDLIIIQIEGSKRWQFFGPPVSDPVRGMPRPPLPEEKPIFDEVLRPGDLLFLPAGVWHHCEGGPGRSIHLGIFFAPPSVWHAVKALTSELLNDELFRKPLTRFEDASELLEVEAVAKERLMEKIGRLKLSDVVSNSTNTDRE